jgi:hypothetical protein
MDLQPELSISAGLIRPGSLAARMLTFFGDRIIHHAEKIMVLDRFMVEHVLQRGGRKDKIYITPLWPVLDKMPEADRMQNPFRIRHGFGNKLVVMYSGNHSLVHPLETLLNSALLLKEDSRFLFVFIGEGMRKKEVGDFRQQHQLENIVQFPFQPREEIHHSLGSADYQVVIMGEKQVGFTHPNKIYGALFLGKPIIYIGPEESHVGDILKECPGNIMVSHGEAGLLVEKLLLMAGNEKKLEEIGRINQYYADQYLQIDKLKHNMLEIVEN